jgi:hypothetical protein
MYINIYIYIIYTAIAYQNRQFNNHVYFSIILFLHKFLKEQRTTILAQTHERMNMLYIYCVYSHNNILFNKNLILDYHVNKVVS